MSLLAALADAEVLRHDLEGAHELLRAEQRRTGDVVRELESLRDRLAALDERQRELHVLLLHRDQEISRLHGYLAQAQAQVQQPRLEAPEAPAPAPASPTPSPPVAPPATVPPAGQRALRARPPRSELAAAVVAAADWWDRFSSVRIPLSRRRPGSHDEPRPGRAR